MCFFFFFYNFTLTTDEEKILINRISLHFAVIFCTLGENVAGGWSLKIRYSHTTRRIKLDIIFFFINFFLTKKKHFGITVESV